MPIFSPQLTGTEIYKEIVVKMIQYVVHWSKGLFLYSYIISFLLVILISESVHFSYNICIKLHKSKTVQCNMTFIAKENWVHACLNHFSMGRSVSWKNLLNIILHYTEVFLKQFSFLLQLKIKSYSTKFKKPQIK